MLGPLKIARQYRITDMTIANPTRPDFKCRLERVYVHLFNRIITRFDKWPLKSYPHFFRVQALFKAKHPLTKECVSKTLSGNRVKRRHGPKLGCALPQGGVKLLSHIHKACGFGYLCLFVLESLFNSRQSWIVLVKNRHQPDVAFKMSLLSTERTRV